MKRIFQKVSDRCPEWLSHTLHVGGEYGHVLYFGVLFLESHYIYAKIGGIVGLIVLLSFVFPDNKEKD